MGTFFTVLAQSNLQMSNTAKVHLWFRGASEVTKSLRRGSLLCELGAAGVSLWAILGKPPDSAAGLPLAILGIAFVGTFLRAYSGAANGFAQRCRRISLRAFCTGEEVDTLTVSILDDEAPPFVERLAAKLPAKSLEEYYEPTTAPGEARQRELYAHSAFYTWRLLRVQGWGIFAFSLLALISCGVLIYHLAAEPTAQGDRKAILEAVCTVVLLVVTMKGFEASWDCYQTVTAVRAIENRLLEKPKGGVLKDLIDSYDLERAAGPNPMTIIYTLWRNRLASKWTERRKNLTQ